MLCTIESFPYNMAAIGTFVQMLFRNNFARNQVRMFRVYFTLQIVHSSAFWHFYTCVFLYTGVFFNAISVTSISKHTNVEKCLVITTFLALSIVIVFSE